MQTGIILITISPVDRPGTARRQRPGPRAAALAVLAAAAAGLALLLAGCGGSEATGGDGSRLEVVATTTQIGDWVRRVGGEAVSVDQILEPNTDPHEYEPRPSDVAAVAGADLVFANGDGLDDWIGELVSDGGGNAVVVDLGARLPVRLAGDGGEGGSAVDPHWWHDPHNAESAVTEIERRLSTADPARRATFARNAEAYGAELRRLDRRIAACIGSIPAARRKLVTDHDAFGYLARRYGIDVVGAVIPSQTTEAQASARDLSELIDLVESEAVGAIFPESSLSSRVVDAVARQTGATAGETLYGDSLGAADSAGATYLGMERANADALVRGLSGGRRGC